MRQFSADPLFVDPGNLDFHLSPGSSAIDAGLTSEVNFSGTDYYGTPRVVAGNIGDGAIVDVGASAYQPPAPLTTPTPSATPTLVGNQINVPVDFPTIQDAINASSDGDVIMVAPGTYFEAINLEGKAIQVMSTNGPAVTTIDGHGLEPVVTFASGETRASVLSGFTITAGLALNSLLYAGDGININDASPTITNTVIIHTMLVGARAGSILTTAHH